MMVMFFCFIMIDAITHAATAIFVCHDKYVRQNEKKSFIINSFVIFRID